MSPQAGSGTGADLRRIAAVTLHWARIIFTPLSLLVMALLVWQAGPALGSMIESARIPYLVLALGLWSLANLLVPLSSVLLFLSCGERIGYRAALGIHVGRLPAKYLPGGIWHSVGRANDYLLAGFSRTRVWLYFFMENLLLVAVTLVLSSGIVAPLVAVPLLQELVALMAIPLGLVLLMMPVAVRIVTRGRLALGYAAYASSALLQGVYWCANGLAFAAYIFAFDGLTDLDVVQAAAIYVFSWSIGYLALFAPQGIGVSEFVAANLLGGEAAHLVAFLVGFRVLVLVADLLCWGLLAIVRALGKQAKAEDFSG